MWNVQYANMATFPVNSLFWNNKYGVKIIKIGVLKFILYLNYRHILHTRRTKLKLKSNISSLNFQPYNSEFRIPDSTSLFTFLKVQDCPTLIARSNRRRENL